MAHSGQDAIDKACDFHPEILAMDLMLGEMSGLNVAKTLRESHAFSDILIVALSGNGSPEHRRQTKVAGFNLHLETPVSVDDVEVIIDRRRESTSENRFDEFTRSGYNQLNA